MKKNLLLLLTILSSLTSCNLKSNSNNSFTNNSNSLNEPVPSELTSSVESSINENLSNTEQSMLSENMNSNNSTKPSASSVGTIPSPSLSPSPSQADSSISSSVLRGDSIYPIPSNFSNRFEIGGLDNRTSLNLQSLETVSSNVNFIYGNNIVNASAIDFYAENEGGGMRMRKVNPGYGVQTKMFTHDWLKLQIVLEISSMHNHSDQSLSKTDSVFVINAYNEKGKFLRSVEWDNFDLNMKNHSKNLYMNAVDVAYLEILNTNLPHKGNQFYNFGLKGIQLLGFPYPYE